MNKALAALLRTYPLPPEWGRISVLEDSLPFGEWRLHRRGLSFEEEDRTHLAGSAAWLENPQSSAGISAAKEARLKITERAFFELLERAHLWERLQRCVTEPHAEFPLLNRGGKKVSSVACEKVFPGPNTIETNWVYSKSNGVALHCSLTNAINSAGFELLERDRFLRFWYGRQAPRRLPASIIHWPGVLAEKFDLAAYHFGDDNDLKQGLAVVGIFGFPRAADLPLLLGWGARAHLKEACEKAMDEVYQRLAFLIEEPLLSELPSVRASPTFHLDYYHCPHSWSYLKQWLLGALDPMEVPSLAPQWSDLQFVQLMADANQNIHLIKALSDHALKLTFGSDYRPFDQSLTPPIPAHPIA